MREKGTSKLAKINLANCQFAALMILLEIEVERVNSLCRVVAQPVWPEKSPNVYKSCPKMISQEKWYILIPLQKLPKISGRFGQNNCCQRL